MKKSKLLFTAAISVWALGITYMVLNLLREDFRSFSENLFPNFHPFIGFVFVFIGIAIAKKGSELYNVENGRAANYRVPRTKAQNTGLYAVLIGFALIAIILITTQFVNG